MGPVIIRSFIPFRNYRFPPDGGAWLAGLWSRSRDPPVLLALEVGSIVIVQIRPCATRRGRGREGDRRVHVQPWSVGSLLPRSGGLPDRTRRCTNPNC